MSFHRLRLIAQILAYAAAAPFVIVALGLWCCISLAALLPYLLLHDVETGPH